MYNMDLLKQHRQAESKIYSEMASERGLGAMEIPNFIEQQQVFYESAHHDRASYNAFLVKAEMKA